MGGRLSTRRGAQLVEEALLLVMAVVMMGLVISGIQSAFTTIDKLAQNAWKDVTNILDSLFGYLWNW
jgi:hypothetical protein